MAKKRASLKDKGIEETLGPTPQSNRGLDVLFGKKPSSEEKTAPVSDIRSEPEAGSDEAASATQPQAEVSQPDAANQINQEQESMPANESSSSAGLPEETPAVSSADSGAVQDRSLPANDADNEAEDNEVGVTASEEVVDDLGLPAAMEGPPPFEGNSVESLPVNEADAELGVTASEEVVDDLGLPAAMEGPPPDLVPASTTTEYSTGSGTVSSTLAGEASTAPRFSGWEAAGSPGSDFVAGVEPAATSSLEPVPAPRQSLPVDEAADINDLTGLGADDDMSGLMGDADAAPAAQGTIPPANLPPAAPSSGAAPDSAVPPISQPGAGAVPTTTGSPPTPPTSSPRPSPFRMPQSKIESFEGIISERIRVDPQDIAPEDAKARDRVTNIISVKEREEVDEDEAMTAKVVRFVGRERRENLDEEIENLYNLVANELSVNKEDTEYAFHTLREAQDLVFEDPRQYDEALYLVATIRAMLARKRNLARWSYTWGLFVFFYAVVWLLVFVAGFINTDILSEMFVSGSDGGINAVAAAWFSALAGGIGGGLGILYSLYWHVAMKQDFDRQYVMYYLVQPVMGFFLGGLVYFIIASGFLLINFSNITSDTATSGEVLSSTTVIAIQILLGCIAGFRQRFVFEMIDKIVQKVSPRPPAEDEEAKKPVSLAPSDQRELESARSVTVKTDKTTGAVSEVAMKDVEVSNDEE